ncbi:MAG: WG repeat-containing protein, partial [Prevotellaceae bacterium]|nr:WG repeat-containing protein [Prevotellaceae bacterium]
MTKFLSKLFVMCSLLAFCISCSNSNQADLKLIPVKSGEKWGYINKKGEYVINPQFQDAGFFCDGVAKVVSSDGKTGYINEDGKYAIPAQFKSGTDFADGLAFVVSDGGHPTCINKKGETKFQLNQAKYVFAFSEGLALFVVKEKDDKIKSGFADKSGKVVINPQFEEARPFSEGFAAIQQKDKWGFIDKTGKIVI